MTHLDSDSVRVRLHASGALALLSIDLDAKRTFVDCGPSAVAHLVSLLNDQEDVACNAQVAIRHLAELPVLMTRFVGALVLDLKLLRVVFRDLSQPFVQPLCDLLPTNDGDLGTHVKQRPQCSVYPRCMLVHMCRPALDAHLLRPPPPPPLACVPPSPTAAVALESLLSTPDGALAVTQALHIVPRLGKVATGGGRGSAPAAKALAHLAAKFPDMVGAAMPSRVLCDCCRCCRDSYCRL